MTADELAAIIEGIAPVIRECVRHATFEQTVNEVVRQKELAGLVAAVAELGPLRERLAGLEARPLVPGPAGQAGAPGPPGKDGANGKAGLEYRGVFVDGQCYDVGDLVTWAGSAWHCNEPTTTKPGEGSKAWTLMVKRGRDSKS